MGFTYYSRGVSSIICRDGRRVFLTKNLWGVNSFAVFKLVSGTFAMLFYLHFIIGFLNESTFTFLKETIVKLILPLVIEIGFLLLIIQFLPVTKGKLNLLLVIMTGGVGTLLGFFTLYFTSNYYKIEFNHYCNKIVRPKRVKGVV